MRRNKRRNQRRSQAQRLTHVAQRNITSATGNTISSSDLAMLHNRPARVVSLKVTYASSSGTANNLQLTVLSAESAQIFKSSVLIAALNATTKVFTMPANTDWGLYTNADDVIEVNVAATTGIRIVYEVVVLYKDPPVSL